LYVFALLFFLRKEWRWMLFAVFIIALNAISSSFFFEPGIFFLMFLLLTIYLRRVKWHWALLILLSVNSIVPVIQQAKSTFRLQAFTGVELSFMEKASMFVESYSQIEDELDGQALSSELIVRLNQGFYDSHVYAGGLGRENTIVPSFFSVFVPRFLWKDKPGFDSRKLKEYGGYDRMGSSFISISQVCESYLSWGKWGGIAFLFFYGIALNYILFRCATAGGMYVICLPILFLHVLRVEVDFVHVFSSLVHGGIAYWILTKRWNFSEGRAAT